MNCRSHTAALAQDVRQPTETARERCRMLLKCAPEHRRWPRHIPVHVECHPRSLPSSGNEKDSLYVFSLSPSIRQGATWPHPFPMAGGSGSKATDSPSHSFCWGKLRSGLLVPLGDEDSHISCGQASDQTGSFKNQSRLHSAQRRSAT